MTIREQNEQARLARLPEVTARYNAGMAKLKREKRELVKGCSHCALARQHGEVVYCGRCSS